MKDHEMLLEVLGEKTERVGIANNARHFIQRTLNPRPLSQMAPCDMASHIRPVRRIILVASSNAH